MEEEIRNTQYTIRKRFLFTGMALMLVWIPLETMLHALTYLGVVPYIPLITPACYTKETVKLGGDKYGCPIFVDGQKVYRQIGVPAQPLQLDAEGYRPIDAKRFDSPNDKIGFFGDSFTEGLQVDDSETFPRLMEKRFRQKGKSTICFNFGIGGTGTYHQYLRYLTVSERAHLNDVVLCFFPQNDVLNNHERLGVPFELPKSPYLAVRNGEFVEVRPDGDMTPINRRLSWLRSTIGMSFFATGYTGAESF